MKDKKDSKQRLMSKLKGTLQSIGKEASYHALVLFYTLRAPDTPAWCKSVALGALAYFISLVDGIPDLTPFLGYTDDVALMAATIAALSAHITPAIKERAERESSSLFNEKD